MAETCTLYALLAIIKIICTSEVWFPSVICTLALTGVFPQFKINKINWSSFMLKFMQGKWEAETRPWEQAFGPEAPPRPRKLHGLFAISAAIILSQVLSPTHKPCFNLQLFCFSANPCPHRAEMGLKLSLCLPRRPALGSCWVRVTKTPISGALRDPSRATSSSTSEAWAHVCWLLPQTG